MYPGRLRNRNAKLYSHVMCENVLLLLDWLWKILNLQIPCLQLYAHFHIIIRAYT